MPDNSPSPEKTKRKSAGPVVAVLLLVQLPLLYIASVGPAVWLEKHGYLPAVAEPAAHAVYAPFRFARENCPPFRGVVDRYIALWMR